MLSGTVILAHRDPGMIKDVAELLTRNSPALHLERTTCGGEALMLQSVMRADAVLMGMNFEDMSAAHLLCELKRDIVNPYVMVCVRNIYEESCERILRLGANSIVHAPVDVPQVCARLEEQIRIRRESEGGCAALEENMIRRIFMDYGLSCSMKGYAYLKCAVRLLRSQQASVESMGELYEKIALRHAVSADSIERSMRYTIKKCWEKRGMTEKQPGNRDFLIRVMEECGGGRQTIIKPRISLFTSGRRVFR